MADTNITIHQALQKATQQLLSSESARLDSEILLLKVLNDSSDRKYNKTWLLTWPETTLTSEQLQQFEHYLQLRQQGMPIAYITGEKDFWTLTLNVSPATLIPRPETELLVEAALDKLATDKPYDILDMGTGSGAIALAIASERPLCKILASDSSLEALDMAKKNSKKLNISNVSFCQSHWFENIPRQSFDIIVSNPPYIAHDDPDLEDNVKQFEPLSALYAGNDGLNDIREIIQNSHDYLCSGGWLLFEHGYSQAQAIQNLLENSGFTQITTLNDLNHLARVTQAQLG